MHRLHVLPQLVLPRGLITAQLAVKLHTPMDGVLVDLQLVAAGGAEGAGVTVVAQALVRHEAVVGEPLLARAGEGAEVAAILDPVVDGHAVQGEFVVARAAEGAVLAGEPDIGATHSKLTNCGSGSKLDPYSGPFVLKKVIFSSNFLLSKIIFIFIFKIDNINWAKILDPDPNSMYLDPQHCQK